MTSFLSLGVPEPLAAVLSASGKTEAFPIQRDTLPDSLSGRDVLGRGRTGSGKTIAFALPLVARLAASRTVTRPGRPRGLVLAPTRELATQIATTVRELADAAGLSVTTIFGGVSQKPQEQALRRGVDIVVACPGRLEDLQKQGVVDLGAVAIAVLDEADHMADLGFLPGVTRILASTPAEGQRLLFSATLDRGVDKLVKRFLHDAVSHSVDESSVPQGVMTHRVFLVPDGGAKTALVRHLASGRGRRIMFTRTKHQAKRLARQLTASGIPAVDLQGNLSQNARERNLAAFGADPADGGVRVLVATDVAARGVHVDDVELVVHVDPPVEHKAYLHRSGRTARAGAEGVVVTVALDEQRRDVVDLLRAAKLTVPFESVAAGDATVSDLVGEPAPHVQPAPAAEAAQGGGRGGGSGRSGSGRGGSGRGGSGGSGSGRATGAGGVGRVSGAGSAGRGAGAGGRGSAGQTGSAHSAGAGTASGGAGSRRRRGGRGNAAAQSGANGQRGARGMAGARGESGSTERRADDAGRSQVDARGASTGERRRDGQRNAETRGNGQGGQRGGGQGGQRGGGQGGQRGGGQRHTGGQHGEHRGGTSAPQSGRTAAGKPTIGATVGSVRRGGSRRASHPGGR